MVVIINTRLNVAYTTKHAQGKLNLFANINNIGYMYYSQGEMMPVMPLKVPVIVHARLAIADLRVLVSLHYYEITP